MHECNDMFGRLDKSPVLHIIEDQIKSILVIIIVVE